MSPSQLSVSEVVRLAEMQLQQLISRQEEITRRIQHLRVIVGTPRPLQDQPHGRRSCPRERSTHTNRSLLRACRIALLEVEGPASAEEIHSRILRRGSFLFRGSRKRHHQNKKR